MNSCAEAVSDHASLERIAGLDQRPGPDSWDWRVRRGNKVGAENVQGSGLCRR